MPTLHVRERCTAQNSSTNVPQTCRQYHRVIGVLSLLMAREPNVG
jgi:hypothetical protein